MSYLKSALSCLLFCLLVVNAKIPDYIKVCKKSNNDVSKCISNSVEFLREKLIVGIPDLNVPPIEPLQLDDIRVNKGLKLNLTDVVVSGTGKFRIKDLKADVEKNRFAVLIYLPELKLTGKHTIDMKLLTIPLKGNGPFSATFTEFNLGAKMIGQVNTDDEGVKKLKFDLFYIQVSISGKKEMHIDGLFDENPTLKMAAQAVIAENIDVLLEELFPEIENSLSTTLTCLANKITSKFNYDELFPH